MFLEELQLPIDAVITDGENKKILELKNGKEATIFGL